MPRNARSLASSSGDAVPRPPAGDLLLDVIATPALAALDRRRRLRSGYAGFALRVRLNDGVLVGFPTLDVEWDGDVPDDAALLAFTSSFAGRVLRWYDQGPTLREFISTGNDPMEGVGGPQPEATDRAGLGYTNLYRDSFNSFSENLDGTMGLSGSPALTIAWAGDWRVSPGDHGVCWFFIGAISEPELRLLVSADCDSPLIGPGFIRVHFDSGAYVQFNCSAARSSTDNLFAPAGKYRYVLQIPAGGTLADVTLTQDGVPLVGTVSGSAPLNIDGAGFVRLCALDPFEPGVVTAASGLSFWATWDAVLAGAELAALDAHLETYHSFQVIP